MKKKVLHIIIRSSYDGSAIYPVRLCEKMEEYNHTIISCFKGNAYEEILAKGIRCENLINSNNISYKYLLLKYWRLIKYLRKDSFAIIHYHNGGVGVLILAVIFKKRAQVIHHLHGGNLIGDHTKQNISFIHLVLLKLISKFSYKIAVANHVFDEYESKVKHIDRLNVIRNSVPFIFQKKEAKTSSIGYIGRSTKEKGFSLFLAVSEQLKVLMPNINITAMGEIQVSSKQINLHKPCFNVEKFYKEIDLLLFTSTATEGLPLVILEAIAFDVGIIAFPLKGIVEILGEDYPLLVNDENLVALKISDFYSSKFDHQALSDHHFKLTENFKFDEMIEKINKLYISF